MFRRPTHTYLLITMLAALFTAPARAQEVIDEWFIGPPPPPEFPTLVFESTTVDMGKIEDTEKTTATFHFRNEGPGTLVIESYTCSCGCTAAKLDKRTYAPGESGVIEAVFNPEGRMGKQQKSCTVTSNDPQTPRVRLAFTCEILSVVWTNPPRAIVASNVPRGEGLTRQVAIMSRAEHFEITNVSVNGDLLTTELAETERVEIDGELIYRTMMDVTVSSDAPVGWFNRQITIRVNAWNGEDAGDLAGDEATGALQSADNAEAGRKPTRLNGPPGTVVRQPADEPTPRDHSADAEPGRAGASSPGGDAKPDEGDEREHVVRLMLRAEFLGDLTFESPQLLLSTVTAGEMFEGEITLLSRSGTPFQILDVVAEGAQIERVDFDITEVSEPGVEKRVIRIRGVAPTRPGLLRGRLQITTDVKGQEAMFQRFRGKIVASSG